MKDQSKRMFLIKFPYWLGIGADALWAIAFFFPFLYGNLVGNPDFIANFETKQILRIAGTLMAGWTILLLWAVRNPIERRVVILLTAFPVVFGLILVELTGYFIGRTTPIWVIVKTIVLFTLMIISYFLAKKENRIS